MKTISILDCEEFPLPLGWVHVAGRKRMKLRGDGEKIIKMERVSEYLSEDRVHAGEVEMFVTFQKGKITGFFFGSTIADIPKMKCAFTHIYPPSCLPL